jgi:uncharacterized membrane protein
MRTTLLALHIIGAATWLGANMVQAFMSSRIPNAPAEIRQWWSESLGAMTRLLYNVAAVLILVTGVWLVLISDYLSFADTFVTIGFLAIIVGAVLGMAVFGPGLRQLSAAIGQGDTEAEAGITRRLTAFGVLDTLVVVVTIVAMVAKWGLG